MFLSANDAISGKEGSAIAVIDGVVEELAEIKSFSAKLDKKKKEFNSLGHRGTQQKATGWTGTGTVTFYYVTSRWVNMVVNYAKTGKDVYFDMLVTNEDPSSSIGAQRIRLGMCNIDGAEIAKLDVDADFLDATFSFTFSDIDVLDSFDPFSA